MKGNVKFGGGGCLHSLASPFAFSSLFSSSSSSSLLLPHWSTGIEGIVGIVTVVENRESGGPEIA